MSSQHSRPRRNEGFTLIEVMIALAILGMSLFVLLDMHYNAVQVQTRLESEVRVRNLLSLASGISEVEIAAGNLNGSEQFGDRYPDWSYSFDAEEFDSSSSSSSSGSTASPAFPGLYYVVVKVQDPDKVEYNLEYYTVVRTHVAAQGNADDEGEGGEQGGGGAGSGGTGSGGASGGGGTGGMMRRGFTLLEVLVAMSILIVIVAVVYASFASVTDTISVARVRTEETRLRQFLERSLRTNLTSVYVDRAYEQQVFQFVGINDQNTEGPRDSLRFVSTNQLMGGLALPGDFKEVRYEVFGGEEGRVQLSADQKRERDAYESMDMNPDQAKLEATETPLLASNAQAVDTETGNIDLDNSTSQSQSFDQRRQQNKNQSEDQNANAAMYQAPSWSVPIRTLDITYFDGVEWVEEWDSTTMGRLPWCVQIRINFARTDEEIQREIDQNIDIENSPDFEMVVPLPIALGLQTDGRALNEMENAEADAENAEGNSSGATTAGAGAGSGSESGSGTGSGTTTGRPGGTGRPTMGRPGAGGAGRPGLGRPGGGGGSIFGGGRNRPSNVSIPRNLGGRS